MLEALKETVCRANKELKARNVVIYTWGNVSARDTETGLIVIKPSGVEYDTMKPEDMVVMDLSGRIVEGTLRPSSDTPTHLVLYKAFPEIGGIVHTHSTSAAAFAQAGQPIPALGTTHADYFHGPVPVTRMLTAEEVEKGYEENTGKVIVETVKASGKDSLEVPAILTGGHGPFTWGKNADEAVYHAVVLEEVARMALYTSLHNPEARLPQYILDKHYERKHGPNAYYGQK